MSRPLAGLLGEGAEWTGDLVFDGAVRIDGRLHGRLVCHDLVEIGPRGRVEGDVVAVQALVAGAVIGRLEVSERATLLDSARIEGALVCPWLDVRVGAQVIGDVRVQRAV